MPNEITRPEGTSLAVQVPVSTGTLAPLPPLPPSDRLTVIPEAKFDVATEKVPEATGNKPAPFVEHQWGASKGTPPAARQPDWLNDGSLDGGNGGRTCAVCGVTERTRLIRADRKGMDYHYVDAYGVAMSSLVPLGCPTFLGDVAGAAAETKQRVRNLDAQHETMDARMTRLEQDNAYLRAKLEEKITVDVTGLVEWLAQVAALSNQAGLPSLPVSVAGLSYEVPKPVADMIIDVAAVPVPVKDEEKE